MTNSVFEKVKNSATQELDKLTQELKKERDELRLQIHLMGAEAKDEWQEVEKNFTQFSQQACDIGHKLEKVGQEGVDSVKKLGGALRDAFRRTRDRL